MPQEDERKDKADGQKTYKDCAYRRLVPGGGIENIALEAEEKDKADGEETKKIIDSRGLVPGGEN